MESISVSLKRRLGSMWYSCLRGITSCHFLLLDTERLTGLVYILLGLMSHSVHSSKSAVLNSSPREMRQDIIWHDKEESLSTNLYFARGKQKRWNGKGLVRLNETLCCLMKNNMLWEKLLLNILQEKKRRKKKRETFGHLNQKNAVRISLWAFGKKRRDGQ